MFQNKSGTGWAVAIGVLALAMVLGLGGTFAVWTATSWLAFPRFLLAVVILFVLPGSQIVCWCGLKLSPIENVTIATVLGMISTCFVYAVLTWLGAPFFLYVWIVVPVLTLTRKWWRGLADVSGRTVANGAEPAHLVLLLVVIAS